MGSVTPLHVTFNSLKDLSHFYMSAFIPSAVISNYLCGDFAEFCHFCIDFFFFFFCIGPFYSPGEKFVTSECTHQLLRQSEL